MSALMQERVAAPPVGALCEAIVEQLEAAVLVVDGGSLQLLHANRAAREALGATHGALPRPVLSALSEWLSTEPPRLRFAGARALVAPSGQRFHARAKRLGPLRPEVMVLLTPAVRDHQIGEVLRERFGLSQRELQVVMAVRAGLANSEIATRLGLSEGTVKNYLSRAFGAVGVRSRTHLSALLQSLALEE